MKKVVLNNFIAGMLSKRNLNRIKEFIAKNEAFSLMSSIEGTPPYWEKFLH